MGSAQCSPPPRYSVAAVRRGEPVRRGGGRVRRGINHRRNATHRAGRGHRHRGVAALRVERPTVAGRLAGPPRGRHPARNLRSGVSRLTCRECRSCMTAPNQQPAGTGAAIHRSGRREVILDSQLPPERRTQRTDDPFRVRRHRPGRQCAVQNRLDALGEPVVSSRAAGRAGPPPRKSDDHGRSRAVTHSRRGRPAFPGRPEDRDPVGGRGIDRIDPDTRRAPPVPGIRGPAATRPMRPDPPADQRHHCQHPGRLHARVARAARDRSTHTTRTSQSLPVAPSAHRRGATSFSRSFTSSADSRSFQVGDRDGQRVQWSVSAVCTQLVG